jgi:hypothetical protein
LQCTGRTGSYLSGYSLGWLEVGLDPALPLDVEHVRETPNADGGMNAHRRVEGDHDVVGLIGLQLL